MMEEIWKDVVGYEGLYRVSNIGRVWSLPRVKKGKFGITYVTGNRIMKTPKRIPDGYPSVTLVKNGFKTKKDVHLIMARAFLGEPERGFQCCHKDGNPGNCTIENIYYGTVLQNNADRRRHGHTPTGEKNPKNKLKRGEAELLYKVISDGRYSCGFVACIFKISKSTVLNIKNKKTWRELHV